MTALAVTAPARRSLGGPRRLLGGIALGAAATLALVVGWLALHGGGAFTVLSGSMAPTLQTGDLVLLERIDARDAVPGDVIAFPSPDGEGRTIVHRAQRITPKGGQVAFVTRGDANATSERWTVPDDGSVGRVRWAIPQVGHATHFAASPAGWLALVIVPAGLLALFELRNLLRRGDR